MVVQSDLVETLVSSPTKNVRELQADVVVEAVIYRQTDTWLEARTCVTEISQLVSPEFIDLSVYEVFAVDERANCVTRTFLLDHTFPEQELRLLWYVQVIEVSRFFISQQSTCVINVVRVFVHVVGSVVAAHIVNRCFDVT
ncbi:hypothetical protein D3C85_1240920 [compost metagenome]